MQLAKVVGRIVATRKDPGLHGAKLLIVRPLGLDGELGSSFLIAVDTVGAGAGEAVLVVQGSSARMAEGFRDTPVDATVVGIVDEVQPDIQR